MIAAEMFVRGMLRRPPGGSRDPEPLIGLLGPRGSGKSTVLRAMSQECGGVIMHARLDFADAVAADPISAVAFVAFELMRNWTNLPKDPTFHRVGLSLLVLREPVPADRTATVRFLSKKIGEYREATREGQVAKKVERAVLSTADLAMSLVGIDTAVPQAAALQALAKQAIGYLLGLPSRWSLRRAQDWFSRQFEGATLVNSLAALSRRSGDLSVYLMDALLADLAENATQQTVPVKRCACVPAEDRNQPHEHAWVLLADNASTSAGEKLLTALVKARQKRIADHSADRDVVHDPLLVVAAVDRWRASWGNWWREPWRTDAASGARQRIPLLSSASMDQWHSHLGSMSETTRTNTASTWYPVWLDPMDAADTSTLASAPSGWDDAEFIGFVRRLSADLPIALETIAEWVMSHPPNDDTGVTTRSVFATSANEESPLWDQALQALLPSDLLTAPLWRVAPIAVAVACHQRHNSHDPAAELDSNTFPDAARTLRLLRSSLWVSTFDARPSPLWSVGNGDAEPVAVMHPWLRQCLLVCLAVESANADRRRSAWTWDTLFDKLSCVDKEDPAHRLYYDLACDRFDDVVDALVERFTVDNHRDWIRLLDTVTSAPCRWPAVEDPETTLDRLAPEDQHGRTPLQATIANLVALLWLHGDPLSLPNRRWNAKIRAEFNRLRSNESSRTDTSALEEAAERFQD